MVHHLKIHDGWTPEAIFVDTSGFLIPKNMGIDTKIIFLSALEVKLWQLDSMDWYSHLKGGTFV